MISSKLIQLISEDYEALFLIPSMTTEKEVRKYWADYSIYDDACEEGINFEDYMDEFYPEANFERQFVEEINL
jgi:hypothetical protein